MIYGMYLSASGVMTNTYRQDVISNNLANAETSGFKKDIATFRQRLTAAQENTLSAGNSNAILDHMGGGTFAMPTLVDTSQGDIEPTENDLDAAIHGSGFFTVAGVDGQPRLTRDGQFQLNRRGSLTLATQAANPVLDAAGKAITLDPTVPARILPDGRIMQGEKVAARLGVVDAADPSKLRKEGGVLFSYPDAAGLAPSQSQIQGGALERANVDPAAELAQLMETQRQLEANANMIRYQDQTLNELVNTVGKIG